MPTRRYTIEIRDAETGATVIFTAADWTDGELKNAVQISRRLAGLPAGAPTPTEPPRQARKRTAANDEDAGR